MMRNARTMIVGLTVLALASVAQAQLRIGSWNLTEYGGDPARSAAFQTSLFGTYQGRSFAPDVIMLQEVETLAAAQAFQALMNSAPGAPSGNHYQLAPFINGPDSDSACIYLDTRVSLVGATVAVPGGGGANQTIRNVMRYQLRPVGYSSAGATLYLYSSHLKASQGGADEVRRGEEAVLIRNVLNALPAGSRIIFGGDLNLYTNTEPAWVTLTESQADNDGRMFDPINRAGNWNNNASFASVHTQCPTTANSWGGMDDRFDYMLMSDVLSSGQGLSYIGNRTIPFGSVWNDPNHSFRVWGNDAMSFNQTIRVSNNEMVGPVIAQAILDHFAGVNSPPHLPILLDLRVPARAGAGVATIDFGTVAVGSIAQRPITVTNTASLATFSKDGTGYGIDALTYAMSASSGFSAPVSVFEEPADAAASGNLHQISIDTSSVGPRAGTLTIASDDPETPSLVVNLVGNVISPFDYDVNNDGLINIEDLYSWHSVATDVDGNGSINIADRAALLYELRRLEAGDVSSGRR